MYRKIVLILCILFSIVFYTKAQIIPDSVKWMSFDKVRNDFEEVQKPVMIFLMSDDCDSSLIMQQTTFSNPEVANYINILFYPIKFNAYTREEITFFDGTQFLNTTGNKHELAKMLTAENDSLPALIMFDTQGQGQAFFGFKNRDDIFRVLIYYAEALGPHTAFNDWLKYHTRAFPPDTEQVMTRLNVRWLTPEEAMQRQESSPRNILLNFYDYRKISCTVIRTQVFNNPEISNYINQKYYPVNVDIFTNDTLEIFGHKYVNTGEAHNFHQLPIAALNGFMRFPAFVIIDKENNVRDRFQNFYTTKQIKPILYFYGEEAYKTHTWQEFLKEFNEQNE